MLEIKAVLETFFDGLQLEAFADGLQLGGAILLVKGTLFERLDRVYNQGAENIGSFCVGEEGLTLASRGALSRFLLHEWSDTLAGFVLIAVAIMIQAALAFQAAGSDRPQLVCGWAAAVIVVGGLWAVVRLFARGRSAFALRRLARERRRQQCEAYGEGDGSGGNT
jgi:hypothetical protein